MPSYIYAHPPCRTLQHLLLLLGNLTQGRLKGELCRRFGAISTVYMSPSEDELSVHTPQQLYTLSNFWQPDKAIAAIDEARMGYMELN